MEIDDIRANAWRHALQADAVRKQNGNPVETQEAAAASMALSLLLIEQQLDQIRLQLEGASSKP